MVRTKLCKEHYHLFIQNIQLY